jgi:RNA polymerase sigma-70 factor (ECF subfamily)
MQSDDVLMQRVRAGDEEAFAEIVDRYKNSLVNYVTHLVRSRDRAEEIAQDAFVRLFHKAAQYRDQQKLGPYLFRIATNLVVSGIRREKRWTLLLPRLRAGTPQSAAAPDAELTSGEIRSQVSAALEKLPVHFRAPLVLFEMEEWSYEQIGAALGLRPGTVKSRISRARDLMRRQLAPWWLGGTGDERQGVERSDPRVASRERIARLHP